MENKFEQLLRGNLPKDESKKLLKEIELNPTLKKEFTAYQNSWDLVKTLERRKLKEKVSQIVEHNSEPQQKNWRWAWYSAASILVILLSYWVFQPKPSTQSIAQNYFQPYPDKYTSMGESIEPLSEAMSAYNKRNFQEAENLFKQLPKELRDDIKLYRGICLYQMGEKTSAKKIFRKLNQSPSSEYEEPSLWYLSLTHLALNEKDSAITTLRKIKDDSLMTFHKEDAIEIIELLK